MIGDGAVGKTSLIRRFVHNEFDDKYITTMGANVSKKVLGVNKLQEDATEEVDISITLSIWDILGQRSYLRLRPMYYMGADGALVVCDITQRDSMLGLSEWINSLFNITGAIPIIVLANKADLRDREQFDENELQKIADRFRTKYYYTSAKTGNNVEQSFTDLGRYMAINTIAFEKINTPQQVSEAIIDAFCMSHGGRTHAMPVVQHQLDKIHVDLETPTKSDLEKVIESLVEVTKDIKGKDAAKYERQRFRKLLSRIS